MTNTVRQNEDGNNIYGLWDGGADSRPLSYLGKLRTRDAITTNLPDEPLGEN